MCFLEIFCYSQFLFVKEKKKFAFISSFCIEFDFAIFLHYIILSGPFIHSLFSCAKLFMMLLFFGRTIQTSLWIQFWKFLLSSIQILLSLSLT